MPNTPCIPDEQYACRLLTEHFATRGLTGFRCEPSLLDPPDLAVKWDDGSHWGVEVTRTYLQVAKLAPTGDSAQRCTRPAPTLIASAEFIEPLRTFGEAIGQETARIRKRDYTLWLGPPPADSLGLSARPIDFGKRWKKDARTAIVEHLRDDRAEPLKRPGMWLKPGGPGNRWTVAVQPGVKEIALATGAMLERAVTDKVGALPRWNGTFAGRWLLLLNHYPLASDVSDVETAIGTLLWKNPACSGLDGIFWHGGVGSALVAIPGKSHLPRDRPVPFRDSEVQSCIASR